MIKPALILSLRPEDEASDNELEAFLKFGQIKSDQHVRIRIDKQPLPKINLNDYSLIIVGGGPYNVSDDEAKKPVVQKQFEKWLKTLLDEVTETDFPYIGMCYGLGILADYLGGKVSKEKYSEDVGAINLDLTKDSANEEILNGVDKNFKAFAGHKESCQDLPPAAKLLVTNSACPIQMIKYKNNIYATQFHTELDQAGLALRINIYRHAGYFPPEDAEMLIAKSKHEVVNQPAKILRSFTKKYLN